MAVSYEPHDIDPIFAEISGENDRAAIAVGGSMVEYALEQAIRSRLLNPTNDKENSLLFSDNGILSTFREKIIIAYFLKIIGPMVMRDLELIRKIRNQAAHDMNEISFEKTQGIANRCRDLMLAKETQPGMKNPPDLRLSFVVCAQMYTANLLMRSGDSDAVIASAFNGMAPFLDR